MDKQSEAFEELQGEWLRHPITETVAKGLEAEAAKALIEVIGAARMSSEKGCIAAVTKYDALKRFAKTMRGEP